MNHHGHPGCPISTDLRVGPPSTVRKRQNLSEGCRNQLPAIPDRAATNGLPTCSADENRISVNKPGTPGLYVSADH